MKEYIYGLFKGEEQLDQTAIDEKNADFAMNLFKEFSENERYTINKDMTVKLLRVAVECEDCNNTFDEIDVRPYKYEPNILLCEDCYDKRMEE